MDLGVSILFNGSNFFYENKYAGGIGGDKFIYLFLCLENLPIKYNEQSSVIQVLVAGTWRLLCSSIFLSSTFHVKLKSYAMYFSTEKAVCV